MADKLLFYYFGDDEAYFRALQSEFKKHVKAPFEFHRLYESTDSRIQSLFLKIFNQKPACVFFDFSKHTQDFLHLARITSRTPLDHTMVTVGLVDLLSPIEILKESVATGTNLTFIKSAEIFDVVYSVSKLIAPDSIGEHGFATASLSDFMEVGIICKVGYLIEGGLHIETDLPLTKGEKILFNHYWLKKRIVPSRQMTVLDSSTTNLFYQYKSSVDLEFQFLDEYQPQEGMLEAEVKVKVDERNEKILGHKKTLKRWIDDNMISSLEKKAKVLVVDSSFKMFHDSKRTDKHPYTIRCISSFSDYNTELDRMRPKIIAFNYEAGENTRNNLESLKRLSSGIVSILGEINPFLIVFNTQSTTSDLQTTIQYKNALCDKSELSAPVLLQMADMLQKKISSDQSKSKEKPVKRYFIDKTNRASIGEIVKTVTVLKISETDMVIQTEASFPPGTNLHFLEPVEMFLYIKPSSKPSGKLPEYDGYIHAITETNKKELRRFINAVFFRDLDAQKMAESDEYKKLNEQKMQERLDAEAKAKAEAEAQAQNAANEKTQAAEPKKSKE
jgi:hypothetical protein